MIPDTERRSGDDILDALERATAYFEAMLWESPAAQHARSHLAARGIRPETARSFRLGYAPGGWDGLPSRPADFTPPLTMAKSKAPSWSKSASTVPKPVPRQRELANPAAAVRS